MKTFAYIVTPVTIKELKNYWPLIRILPDFLIKPFLKNLPAINSSIIKRIKSSRGKEIEGYLIICPLIGRQLSEDFALDKIISAAQTAQRLGAKIIGLDGFAAQIADKSYAKIFKSLRIPVTSGSALTAWSVVELLYRLAKIKKFDLKKSSIAVIGAATPIGSLCSKKLSDYAHRIIITDKDTNNLQQLKEIISYLNPIEVQIEEDVHRSIQKADIVVDVNNAALNIEELKRNAVFCSLNPDANLISKKKLRSDITFLKAGLVKLPFPDKLYNDFGLPKGVIPASMAEAILLALERKFVSYSLGDKINLDKLEEIADSAALHGFEIWCPEAPVL